MSLWIVVARIYPARAADDPFFSSIWVHSSYIFCFLFILATVVPFFVRYIVSLMVLHPRVVSHARNLVTSSSRLWF